MNLAHLGNLNHWQIDVIGLGLLMMGAIVSIAPEEAVIIALGLFWGEGKVGLVETLVCIFAGLLFANIILVYLGEKLASRFSKNEGVKLARAYVDRYGAWLIFLTRFTPVVKAPVYLSVGVARYGILRFLRVDCLAACIHVPLLLFLGRFLGKNAGELHVALREISWVAAVLFASSLIFTLYLEIRRRRERRHARSEGGSNVRFSRS